MATYTVAERLHLLADDDYARAGMLEREADEETRDEQVALETIAEEVRAEANRLEDAAAPFAEDAARLVAMADRYSYSAHLTPREDKGTREAYRYAERVLRQQAGKLERLAEKAAGGAGR